MTAIELHPYQAMLEKKVLRAWQTFRSVLMVLSTGGGKTFIFSWLIRKHLGQSVLVAHRREIISQISCSLAMLGVKHRIVAPSHVVKLIRKKHLEEFGKSFIDPHARCGVASTQTLTSAATARNVALMSWINQITLAVFDEGHHYVDSGSWARAVEMMHNAKLLFVTACSERADGKGMGVGEGGFCEVLIEGPQTKWLIDNGFLAPFKYFQPESDLDITDLPITPSGEVSTKALRARVIDSSLVGDVVQHYLKHAPGEQAIGFAADVPTAEDMAASFRAAGISSVSLCGETDDAVRDREMARFKAGEIKVVWNVDLFDEGVDVPAITCVILARVTNSLNKYLQMIGRALRYLPGKTAKVIDPVRNWDRHFGPIWPRVWTLDARPANGRGPSDGDPKTRTCGGCTQPIPIYEKKCHLCGVVQELSKSERSTPEAVGGDLMELDIEGMAVLMEKIRQAQRGDEEYSLDQIKRNLPPIARPADMKRHRSAQYRRKVLENLTGWWLGMQPADRDMAEKQRRFFHRFDIDLYTAHTLSAADTDKLIDRITRGFAYDLVA